MSTPILFCLMILSLINTTTNGQAGRIKSTRSQSIQQLLESLNGIEGQNVLQQLIQSLNGIEGQNVLQQLIQSLNVTEGQNDVQQLLQSLVGTVSTKSVTTTKSDCALLVISNGLFASVFILTFFILF